MKESDPPEESKFPNLLVIGAAKAGTYTLNKYLAGHPQVFMSRIKEPNFFAFGGQGLQFETACRPVARWVDSLEEYLALFRHSENCVVAGECSVSYLYWPGTAERIHDFNPDMKLIVSLRDPVDRAYSSFNFAKSYGIEPLSTLSDGIAAEPRRLEENRPMLLRYRDAGLYVRQLNRFYDVFPRDQIKVILFDNLVKNPPQVIREIYRFIGVRCKIQLKNPVWENAGRAPNDSNALHRLATSENIARRTVRRLLPEPARVFIRNMTRRALFSRPKPLPSGERRRLLPLFRDEILELERLIETDLSIWLK